MENRIELKFEKATTRLAGNPYGRAVFNEQVKSKIDYTKMNIIVFPNSIEKIASSFVQGFFALIIEQVGYSEFDKYVKIETGKEELTRNMREDLFV